MTTDKPEDTDRNDNVTAIEQPISETLYENFMPYAMASSYR